MQAILSSLPTCLSPLASMIEQKDVLHIGVKTHPGELKLYNFAKEKFPNEVFPFKREEGEEAASKESRKYS